MLIAAGVAKWSHYGGGQVGRTHKMNRRTLGTLCAECEAGWPMCAYPADPPELKRQLADTEKGVSRQ